MAATALVHKKAALKKTIAYHLAGIGPKGGLLFKAIERLNKLLESPDDEIALQAIDKLMKLVPYAIEREGTQGQLPGANGAGTVNIQINNFDTFIKDRLSHTNLGKLLSINDLQETPKVPVDIIDLTPPPMPGEPAP